MSQQIAFVVKRIEIDYQFPARLDDLLSVESAIVQIKKASMVFVQKLWRAEVCLCEARVTVACVDLAKMKPIAIPAHIYQCLNQII